MRLRIIRTEDGLRACVVTSDPELATYLDLDGFPRLEGLVPGTASEMVFDASAKDPEDLVARIARRRRFRPTRLAISTYRSMLSVSYGLELPPMELGSEGSRSEHLREVLAALRSAEHHVQRELAGSNDLDEEEEWREWIVQQALENQQEPAMEEPPFFYPAQASWSRSE